MKVRPSLLVAFTLILPALVFDHIGTSASSEFSVYCSSNMDGTGICTKEGTTESIECIILQGSIIGCQDKTSQFRCVQFGQIIANQAQFSCKQVENNSESPSLKEDNDSPLVNLSEPEVNPAPLNLNPFDQTQPKESSIMDGAF